jgi:hypothetical protein
MVELLMDFNIRKNIMLKIVTIIMLVISTHGYTQTCKDYIPDEWQDNRYTDNGDGTVLDIKTNLIWKKCLEGLSGDNCESGAATTHNWKEALSVAQNSDFANHSDWRLPNIKELNSLVKLNCHNPSINANIFPNALAALWTSSHSTRFNFHAWRVNFGYGSYESVNRINSYVVRLVRN